MPQYLLAAEKVYGQIKDKKYFMLYPTEDLNTLMIEIKKAIKNTELKLRYQHIDFENLILSNAQDKIRLDLSLIPKASYQEEFVLWLAAFIEKITDGPKRVHPPLTIKLEIPQDRLKEIALECDATSEAIEKYFQQQKKNKEMKQNAAIKHIDGLKQKNHIRYASLQNQRNDLHR